MKLNNLRYYRTLAGLTQQELADAVRLHRVSIGELESGKHPPRPRCPHSL